MLLSLCFPDYSWICICLPSLLAFCVCYPVSFLFTSSAHFFKLGHLSFCWQSGRLCIFNITCQLFVIWITKFQTYCLSFIIWNGTFCRRKDCIFTYPDILFLRCFWGSSLCKKVSSFLDGTCSRVFFQAILLFHF